LTKLNPEEKRLLDRMIRDRERMGLALGESDREELLKVRSSNQACVEQAMTIALPSVQETDYGISE
jgi:Zn-dependent oligopeptidase